jgi:hypothetical protein
MSQTAAMHDPNRILDFDGVAAVLTSMGVTAKRGGPVTATQVRTWANTKKLPFFRGVDGRRVITEGTLRSYWNRAQQEAVREFESKMRRRRNGSNKG